MSDARGVPRALHDRLRTGQSATLNLQLKKLGTVLRTAREWGLIDEVPAIKRVKEAVKPPKFYDFGEYKRLLASARSLDSLAYIVVVLGGDAGLRTGEIIALRWCDVDLERGVLAVTRNVCRGHEGTPKGGRTRQLPMTPRLKCQGSDPLTASSSPEELA